METNNSIFQQTGINEAGLTHLNTTSKWTRFIGIIYAISGILVLAITGFLAANMDQVAQQLMEYNQMNETVMEFIQGGGKWLFILIMLVISFVIFINAYYLIFFRISFFAFVNTKEENQLTETFDHMGKYLMITTILSILSTISSIGMIIYTLMK
jgi:hypothetical protein